MLRWFDASKVNGVALSALFVALLDLGSSLTRAPRVPLDGGVMLFLVAAWAVLFSAYLPFVLLRAALAGVLERAAPRVSFPLLGAFDWVSFGTFAILFQSPNVPSRAVQLHLFYLAIPVSAAAYAVTQRAAANVPWRWQVLRVVPALGALTLASLGHWDRHEYIRIACLGVFVVGMSSLYAGLSKAPALQASGHRAAMGCVAAAGMVLLGSQLLLPVSHTGRLLLHSRSAHARSVLVPVLGRADRDKDGAVALFGGFDCDPRNQQVHPAASELPGNQRDDNCGGGDGKPAVRSEVSPGAATTPGRDVLLLSFDSLRWDATEHLPEVRHALGSHVEFTHAVSPAAQTFYSLSATIRGKPVRQLRTERRRLWRDPSPSLADALRLAGYRPFTVLTNQRWASEYGVTGGFEVIWPQNHAAREVDAPGPVDDRFVGAKTALAVALTAAAETRGPVLCWLHLMEPHYPFHRDGRTGPKNQSGFEAALRAVDVQAAAFIEAFREARGTDPIIAVFGDHGEEFGEHGGINHGNTVYSDQVRVGLWLSLPGVKARRVAAPVSIAAIPATVLEQLGVAVPASMTEESLLALARGEAPGPDVAVSEMPAGSRYMIAYTGRRFRLVTDVFHRTEELFDLETDPLEQVNVAAAEPQALEAMRELARDWNERH